MRTPIRVGGFVAVLALLFGAAFGVGRLVDDETSTVAADHAPDHAPGYQLRLSEPLAKPGPGTLRFTVEDDSGTTLTRFDVRHEKRLHLIAVDTGYAGYQHLHPTMAADGTWSTPIELAPGALQLYADFAPTGGENAVARLDVRLPGTSVTPTFSKLRTHQVAGYTVTALGDLAAGGTSTLRFEISRDGVPVDDLEPYLGAYGHLVMIRKADGEYLHVHPEDGPSGPEVAFAVTVPSAARYHLYLDFQHAGVVHTASFMIDAEGSDGGAEGHGGADHGDH